MKHYLTVITLFILGTTIAIGQTAAPVVSDTITITFVDNSQSPPVVTTSSPIRISHTGMQQLTAWATATLLPNGVAIPITPSNAKATALLPADQSVTYNPVTAQDIADAIAKKTITQHINNATNWYRKKAIDAATNAANTNIAPIQ